MSEAINMNDIERIRRNTEQKKTITYSIDGFSLETSSITAARVLLRLAAASTIESYNILDEITAKDNLVDDSNLENEDDAFEALKYLFNLHTEIEKNKSVEQEMMQSVRKLATKIKGDNT